MVWRSGAPFWSPRGSPAPGKRKYAGSRSSAPPPLHFDNLLLSACRIACGACSVPGEAGWTRAFNLAHLRYSERLRTASRQPCFALPMLRWPLIVLEYNTCSAPLALCLLNFPPPSLTAAVELPYSQRPPLPGRLPLPRTPLSDNNSSWGRRRGPGLCPHINPLLALTPILLLPCRSCTVVLLLSSRSLCALWQAPLLPLCGLPPLARVWCVSSSES
jgi:hypothetical protein